MVQWVVGSIPRGGPTELFLISAIYLLNPLRTFKKRRKLLYLMTLSTYVIYGLYGIRHVVKDHSDSEAGSPPPPHRLLFLVLNVILTY